MRFRRKKRLTSLWWIGIGGFCLNIMVFNITDIYGNKPKCNVYTCIYVVCGYANISYLCPQRGNGSNNTTTLTFVPCTQILVSKYTSPLTGSRNSWRNGWFCVWERNVQMSLEHLMVALVRKHSKDDGRHVKRSGKPVYRDSSLKASLKSTVSVCCFISIRLSVSLPHCFWDCLPILQTNPF